MFQSTSYLELEPPVNMNKIRNSNIFWTWAIFEYEVKNLNEYVAIPSSLIWWRISSFVFMFPVLAPILESKIEIIKAYCDWIGIFCCNLVNSQWILLQYGSFCREFLIFEYIPYSNMKMNEYGIFEYAKNGHSLGALIVIQIIKSLNLIKTAMNVYLTLDSTQQIDAKYAKYIERE